MENKFYQIPFFLVVIMFVFYVFGILNPIELSVTIANILHSTSRFIDLTILFFIYKFLKSNQLSNITPTPIVLISISTIYFLVHQIIQAQVFLNLPQTSSIILSSIGTLIFFIAQLIGIIKFCNCLKENSAEPGLRKLINRTGKLILFNFVAQLALVALVTILSIYQFEENLILIHRDKIAILLNMIPLFLMGKIFYHLMNGNNLHADNRSEVLDL